MRPGRLIIGGGLLVLLCGWLVGLRSRPTPQWHYRLQPNADCLDCEEAILTERSEAEGHDYFESKWVPVRVIDYEIWARCKGELIDGKGRKASIILTVNVGPSCRSKTVDAGAEEALNQYWNMRQCADTILSQWKTP